MPDSHQRHLVLFQWVMLLLRPYLLQVDLALVVGFLRGVGVVRVVVGLVPVLWLVDRVLVVGFLWVEVVPVVLELMSVMSLVGPKLVAWN